MQDFLNSLKNRLLHARQNKQVVESEILQVVIGDIQLSENKKNRKGPVTLEECHTIVRNVIAGNEEVLKHSSNERLVKENEVLNSLGVPPMMNAQQIETFINENNLMEDVKKPPKAGVAVGMVIGKLKKLPDVVNLKVAVDGSLVKEVIEKIRS